MLFSLGIQPLAIAVWQSSNIQGTVFRGTHYNLLLYADDIFLTLTDPSNLIPVLINCVEEFSQISGYKISFTKSEIMPLDFSSEHKPHLLPQRCCSVQLPMSLILETATDFRDKISLPLGMRKG